ncbi:MAG: hypothetical protein V3U84_05375 [Thiotrichaceae bacterium]
MNKNWEWTFFILMTFVLFIAGLGAIAGAVMFGIIGEHPLAISIFAISGIVLLTLSIMMAISAICYQGEG